MNKTYGDSILRILLTTALLLPLIAFAGFSESDWRFQKDITSYSGGDQYVAMLLDGEAFSSANRGLSDLRIIDDAGSEIPYQLLIERSARKYDTRSSRMYDKLSFEDETRFTLAINNSGELHDRVIITTPSENFRREIIVEGSEDGETWGVLTTSGFVFDVTVRQAGRIEFRTQETTVSYPETTSPYLRVRILDRGDSAIEISSAKVSFEQQQAAQSVEYVALIVSSEVDAEKKTTDVVFDLGSGGLPTDTFTINALGENFSRDVALFGSNDRENWSVLVSRDVLFRFKTPKFNGERLALRYDESGYRYLRVVAQNYDNPPLEIIGGTAKGLLRRIVFPHDPERSYTLYYGNALASYPRYDLASYFKYLETDNLPDVALGPEKLNLNFVEPEIEEEIIPFTERYPWLVPTAFIAVLVLLGGLLRRVLISTKTLPSGRG